MVYKDKEMTGVIVKRTHRMEERPPKQVPTGYLDARKERQQVLFNR